MTAFVLVHGAFHGAWCWVKLKAELERRGHRVTALDMPGCGEDRTPLAEVSLTSHADRIVDALAAEGSPAILVGHSLGTMSVSQATELRPELVRHLVLLAGSIPRDGMSLFTLLQRLETPGRPIVEMPPPGHPWHGVGQDPPLGELGHLFFNGCSEADTAYALARLRPQANAPRVTKLRLSVGRFGSVPHSYVGCTLDNACPVARQQASLALDPWENAYTLPTGHSPFFSAPDALADLLCSL